jgi:parallel beta-helix repeat protein
MKNLITILLLFCSVISFGQINYYPFKAGQYLIYNVGATQSITVDAKQTRAGVVSYRNRVDVVDTIMSVLSTSSLDTLSTFERPVGKILGISFPDSAVYREQLTVQDDSIVYFTRKTAGNNAVIDGADVISGFTEESANLWKKTSAITVHDSIDILSGWNFHNWGTTGATITDYNRFESTDIGGVLKTGLLKAGQDYKIIISGNTTASSVSIFQGTTSATRINLSGTLSGMFIDTMSFTASAATDLIIYFRQASAGTTDITSLTMYAYDEVLQPNLLYLNDTIGIPQTSAINCDTLGQWYWDSSTNDLYVYSTSDPSGDVEIGQRKRIVNIGNKEYITLRNLTIQHSNENCKPGSTDFSNSAVYLINGGHLTAIGCNIEKNGYMGVYAKNSSNLTFDNNIISNNGESYPDGYNIFVYSTTTGIRDFTFTDNHIDYAGELGFYLKGDSTSHRPKQAVISGNHFENNTGTGLYLADADSISVYNNYFDGNGNLDDHAEDYHIGVGSCSYVDIYNNTMMNLNNNDAIQVYSDTLAVNGSSDNVRIFRNYISGVTNGAGIGLIQLHNSTSNNLQVFYNTVVSTPVAIYTYHDGTGTPSSVDIFNNTFANNGKGISGSTNVPIVLKNNIFYNSTLGEMLMNISTSGLTHSNNLYYKPTGALLQYNGSTYDTPAEIAGFEATAITTNPYFINPDSNFALQTGSPAINEGVDLGFTTDILGNPIVGLPDIGSNEYVILTDTIPPVITAFEIDATSYSLSVTASTITGTDNIAVTAYMVKESSTRPTASDVGWTEDGSYTFSTEGSKTLYAWARDAAGNVSDSIIDNVFVTLPVNAGYTTDFALASTMQARRAISVTIPDNAQILSTSFFHSTGSGNVLMAIYADDGSGNPTTLLGTTAATAVTTAAGWQKINLISPVTVTAGQKVWIACVLENAVSVFYQNGSTPRAASTNNYATGMTNPWGAVTFANYDLSIYCTYVKTE